MSVAEALKRCLLVAAILGAALTVPSRPLAAQTESTRTIIGTWVMDLERSDDARRKLQEAVEPDGGASRRRGGAGGVILGGRGGVGPGRGRADGPPPAFVDGWIESVSRITLERIEDTVTLHREGREPLTLVTDGRERAVETENIEEPILRKAHWDDDALLIETKLGKAVRIEEKYELREDDGRFELRVETKINGDRVPREIKFRRVYTRAA